MTVERLLGDDGMSDMPNDGMPGKSNNELATEWQQAPARIKVIGVGGGGCNCVRRMLQHRHVPGVEFAVINTDIKSLESVAGNHNIDSIQIGEKSTRGWGAGGRGWRATY